MVSLSPPVCEFGRPAIDFDLPGVDELLQEARQRHAADLVPLLANFVAAFPTAAPRLGCPSAPHFTRKFRGRFGDSPRSYRRLVLQRQSPDSADVAAST